VFASAMRLHTKISRRSSRRNEKKFGHKKRKEHKRKFFIPTIPGLVDAPFFFATFAFFCGHQFLSTK
jgi:hypothetical protein